jgi:hypothetical protein
MSEYFFASGTYTIESIHHPSWDSMFMREMNKPKIQLCPFPDGGGDAMRRFAHPG